MLYVAKAKKDPQTIGSTIPELWINLESLSALTPTCLSPLWWTGRKGHVKNIAFFFAYFPRITPRPPSCLSFLGISPFQFGDYTHHVKYNGITTILP